MEFNGNGSAFQPPPFLLDGGALPNPQKENKATYKERRKGSQTGQNKDRWIPESR
jgi:hypothetical protein